MNSRKFPAFIYPLIYSLILVAGILIGVYLIPNGGGVTNRNTEDKIESIIQYAEENYVDSVNRESLISDAINGMLQKLDPHSLYIPAEEFNVVSDELNGNFEGVGIQFNIFNDTLMVVNTISGGPSEKAGLMPGDRIVKVDTQNVAGVGITNNDVLKKLKGPKGSKVTVGIKRSGVPKMLSITITRDVIPVNSVDIAFKVDSKTGYIKVNQFTATTVDEFITATQDLVDSGIEKLIIDLRGNSGGYLNAAVDICEQFLSKGSLIVYTEGRKQPKKEYKSGKKGKFRDLKLAVLIDEWSASASEIVAGAIQDNDRGIIVGRRSFGKGLVQDQVELKDGSAVRLTIARYHTPSGRCIQRKYTGSVEEYYTDMLNRYESGELENVDSLKIQDSTVYLTKLGRKVYGGGGIIPDFFVPMERNEKLTYINSIINMGIIYRFAFEYVDKNRNQLKKYKNADDFINGYQVSAEAFESLLSYAEKNGIPRDRKKIEYSRNELTIWMKAFIGRNLFGDKAFYPLMLKIDKTYLKALEKLNAKQLF